MKAAATRVRTYDCRKVIITLGSHMVVGKADDNFITIAKQGDGITTNVGCDSSEERSMDPNEQYKLTLVIQQTSPTNEFLENQYATGKRFAGRRDFSGGSGMGCEAP